MNSIFKNLLLFGGIVAVLAVCAFYGRFDSLSVCRDCGAIARETEWQIPFTSFALARHRTVEPTPLSRTLQSLHHIPADHEHRWWYIHGSGNGVMCALGSGYDVWQAAASDDVAGLIQVAHASEQTAFADQLIRCAFQRKIASRLTMFAAETGIDGFPDPATFDAWFRQHSQYFETFLNPARVHEEEGD